MIVHGLWTNDSPPRPTISAKFICRVLGRKYEGYLEFVVDTAADRTFVVPCHQDDLGIPDADLAVETAPVKTIAGPLAFKFATDCALVFLAADNTPHLKRLTAYFAGQAQSSTKRFWGWLSRISSRAGEGQEYSVLGRDILKDLSIACCNPRELLFLSDSHEKFVSALQPDFGKKESGEWMD